MIKSNTFHTLWGRFVFLTGGISALLTIQSAAVPPHPDLLDDAAAGRKQLPYFITHLDEMHAKGICTGHNVYEEASIENKAMGPKSLGYTGPFKALAILVKFTDHDSSVAATFFDSLIFDSVGHTVADYYDEISYGQLDMVTVNLPSSLGWRTAPETYAYYVNGQNGTGSYPQNTQKLVEDLVDQIDPLVDFSQYDNDDNGYVDVLLVVHSGRGAEVTGSNDDIWSHKWGISPRLKDSVYISSFTVQPEYLYSAGDMTIGVFAHELGHGFGLPDLYDTDYSSRGIGRWGIMSYGSWTGPSGRGGSPAHPCAWSRIQMGFTTPVSITSNTNGQAISSVENAGSIYRLWTSGSQGPEYFLVENRQKTGYDSYIPGSGLLVWHIDDDKSGNTQEWWPGQLDANHYLVALEQADGLFQMEHDVNYGDASDAFPGSLHNSVFDAATTPNSDSYLSGTSFVKVDNITNSADTMFADLIVSFSATVDDDGTGGLVPASIELSQNYPNPFNPTTTISFSTDTDTPIRLEIYNLLGRRIRTLLDGFVHAGTSTISWDGKNDEGQSVATGVYFYRLKAGGEALVKKMVLVR